MTVGAEFTDSKLDDPASNTQGFTDQKKIDAFNGISATRGGKASQRNWAVYVEDNISLTDKTHLIPAIRFDHNSDSGSNWSPALTLASNRRKLVGQRRCCPCVQSAKPVSNQS